MKKILGLAFLFTLIFSACSNSKDGSQTNESEKVSVSVISLDPMEFRNKSAKGIILDVRTPQEIAQGKIPGSQALDFYDADFLNKATQLPKDAEIYIYCAVGARSQEAANQMIQQGYTKVFHLQGGIQAWNMKGLPIE